MYLPPSDGYGGVAALHSVLDAPMLASDKSLCEQIENEVPFLRRLVRRWHRERASAEDLVQDTLLLALSNAHLWTPGTNLRAWLTRIMRNRFLGTAARSARFTAMPEGYEPASANDWTADPTEMRLMLRDTERALQRLPKIQRTVVQTVAIEGHSYEDAAQALGLSVGAVRCHLARARERLRNAVHNEAQTSPCARAQSARVPAAMLGIAMGFALLLGTIGP